MAKKKKTNTGALPNSAGFPGTDMVNSELCEIYNERDKCWELVRLRKIKHKGKTVVTFTMVSGGIIPNFK